MIEYELSPHELVFFLLFLLHHILADQAEPVFYHEAAPELLSFGGLLNGLFATLDNEV